MKYQFDLRDLKSSFISAGLVLAAGAVLLVFIVAGSMKMVAAFLGGMLCILGAYISGNIRLFCLWALAITIPFALDIQLGSAINKGGGENAFRFEICDPFLLALAFFLLRDIWNRRRLGLRIPKVTFLWVLVMVLWGGAAMVFGPYHLTAIHEVVRMMKVMLLFLVITNELQTSRQFLHFTAALMVGVVIQASAGLIQYVMGATLGLEVLGEISETTAAQLAINSVRSQTVFRVSAFMYHPNLFGMYLATLLPLIIGVFLVKTNKVLKSCLFVSAFLGMAALIATLSRSSWLSFAVAFTMLMCLMIFHPGLRQRSLLAVVIISLAMCIACAPFAGNIISRITTSRSDAMLGREEYKRDARKMIKVKPWLGWGLNSYVYAMPPFSRYGAREVTRWYGDWLPPVHNIYYLWWAETGIIGLGVHLALWAGIIRMGIRNFCLRNELMFTINAACLSAMMAFIVDGFFSFTLRVNGTLRVFWVLAGIIMAIHYWHLQQVKNRPNYDSTGTLFSS